MFGELAGLLQKPIPDLSAEVAAKAGFRQHPLHLTSVRNSELLIDVRTCGISGENMYGSLVNPPYFRPIPGARAGVELREGVVERLLQVQGRLRPFGLELSCCDGWRSQELQCAMHDRIYPEFLQKQHPSWSWGMACEETDKYWSKGVASEDDVNPFSPSPHSTGGATDSTLGWIGGEELWMGTIVDDCSERCHADYFERRRRLTQKEIEGRNNRRLYYWVMTEAGFVINPTEWWHACLFDQMWARIMQFRTGIPHVAEYSNTRPR